MLTELENYTDMETNGINVPSTPESDTMVNGDVSPGNQSTGNQSDSQMSTGNQSDSPMTNVEEKSEGENS